MTHLHTAVAQVIEGLRAGIERLRDIVHLVAVNQQPPPAWHADPAVVALANLPEPLRRDAICALLCAPEPLLRIIAVHALTESRFADLLPLAFQSGDTCDDALLTTMLVAAIGRLGCLEHEARVLAALKNPQLFWAAVESLSLLASPPALAALRAAILAKKEDWDRLDIVTIIGEVGGVASLTLLVEVLLNPDESFAPIHGFAAQALGALGDPSALLALLSALADPRITEKGRILWGLGALASPGAFDAIAPFITSARKDWWRSEALLALAACDPARAWPTVADAITQPNNFFHSDPERWMTTLRALSYMHALPHRDIALSWLIDALRVNRGLAALGTWPVPERVTREGGALMAGVIARSIAALLQVDALPTARPEHFSHEQMVRHIVGVVVAHLRAHDHPAAEHLAFAL